MAQYLSCKQLTWLVYWGTGRISPLIRFQPAPHERLYLQESEGLDGGRMSLESLLASEVEAELLELALLGEDALSNCEYTYGGRKAGLS